MYSRGLDLSRTLDTSKVANTLMRISSFYRQVNSCKHIDVSRTVFFTKFRTYKKSRTLVGIAGIDKSRANLALVEKL